MVVTALLAGSSWRGILAPGHGDEYGCQDWGERTRRGRKVCVESASPTRCVFVRRRRCWSFRNSFPQFAKSGGEWGACAKASVSLRETTSAYSWLVTGHLHFRGRSRISNQIFELSPREQGLGKSAGRIIGTKKRRRSHAIGSYGPICSKRYFRRYFLYRQAEKRSSTGPHSGQSGGRKRRASECTRAGTHSVKSIGANCSSATHGRQPKPAENFHDTRTDVGLGAEWQQ